MIIFAAQLAAGILAAIYGGEVQEYLEDEGKEFLAVGYDQDATGVNKTVTLAWDEFQQTVSSLQKGFVFSLDPKDNRKIS